MIRRLCEVKSDFFEEKPFIRLFWTTVLKSRTIGFGTIGLCSKVVAFRGKRYQMCTIGVVPFGVRDVLKQENTRFDLATGRPKILKQVVPTHWFRPSFFTFGKCDFLFSNKLRNLYASSEIEWNGTARAKHRSRCRLGGWEGENHEIFF